jgi:protein-disulfide isomerase
LFRTFARFALATSFAILIAALPVQAAEDISPAQKKAIEAIVKDYLMANPRVIIDAVEAMQKREAAEAEAEVMSNLKSSNKQLRRDPNSYVGGNPDGDVTLVEFFDYRCGYCKKVHPVMAELLKTDSNIRVVYKEFPILGPQSKMASLVAIAASRVDPSKYLQFHNALMTAKGSLNQEAIQDIAAEAGFDMAALSKELRNPEIEQIVADNYQLAKNLGITGTPGFVIGDTIVPGYINISQMRDLVEQARAECKTC